MVDCGAKDEPGYAGADKYERYGGNAINMCMIKHFAHQSLNSRPGRPKCVSPFHTDTDCGPLDTPTADEELKDTCPVIE
jgi:hypothetical protein